MRVLGIDCGTERTGYGVVESDGRRHRLVTHGVVRTSARLPLASRLLAVRRGVEDVIRQHAPEVVAVEEVFHAVNAGTALKLAHVRGVVLCLVAESGLPLGEHSPATIKNSVVGHGRAAKLQVQLMVQSLLGHPDRIASPDAADALAVAICHATRHCGPLARAAKGSA